MEPGLVATSIARRLRKVRLLLKDLTKPPRLRGVELQAHFAMELDLGNPVRL